MAKNSYISPRGAHVSPGVYTNEVEITYAVKSLGITTLGVVGETLKGPAFQPMHISNWREFQDVFGGTSTAKFKGSQYPKYELPYIAKSYLTESEQLEVVRVLGLSGYNAGPAWAITDNNGNVVAILRSRGQYSKYVEANTKDDCQCQTTQYDVLKYFVGEKPIGSAATCSKGEFNGNALKLDYYTSLDSNRNGCDEDYNISGTDATSITVSQTDLGRFKIYGLSGQTDGTASTSNHNFSYAVSLNPYDKDYIINVLGTNPYDGDAPIYVESLYDVALRQNIVSGTTTSINSGLTFFQPYFIGDYCGLEPVIGILSLPQKTLKRKNVGERYLADKAAVDSGIKAVKYDWKTNAPVLTSGDPTEETVVVGNIYTVRQYTNKEGKREYHYAFYGQNVPSGETQDKLMADANNKPNTLVYSASDGAYWRLNGSDVATVQVDLNDYKSSFRYASTPWIVSNLKGDQGKVEVNKLFRFHTISDGKNSNYEVKVSIENIKPDDGTFDVVVRRVDDSDETLIVLEKYSKCTMVPSNSNYIAYRIGTIDGTYESKSKYITVEVNENEASKMSVPAGFLGYPIPNYSGLPISGTAVTNIKFPDLKYNTTYDPEVKNKKQYFGLSSLVGVDIDTFTFKGNSTYTFGYTTNGFHLDSRLADSTLASKLTVDGEAGYTFDHVSANARTLNLPGVPLIGKESEMEGSIFENVNLRKFTVFFYGGFDGWDDFRDSRTNTDEFRSSTYQGYVNFNSGEGYSFNRIGDPESINLNQNGITSDWYAYLGAIRAFSNKESVDINVFATPGIDYVNNRTLVQEAIDMIESERGDAIYVVTTPDKPSGAGDYVDEMYTPEDAVYNLEDSEVDTSYACTYYPWVKYLDTDNNQYIYLPVTKDVVRNFAQTDNVNFSWFAPAGINRGNVDCVRAKFITKLADEDTLYEGGINPVKTFAQDGVKVWGQKTLQVNDSQLDRISVRRLMLRLKKLVITSCTGLIFEPNDVTVKQSFLSTVTPILDSVRSNRGIIDYRIEINDTVESRERRELPVIIYVKPTQTLEYISVTFTITPEGVSFDDI